MAKANKAANTEKQIREGRPEDKAAYKVANGIRGIWRSASQLGIEVPVTEEDIFTTTIKVGMESGFTAEQIARMIKIVVKVINKERMKQLENTPAAVDAAAMVQAAREFSDEQRFEDDVQG